MATATGVLAGDRRAEHDPVAQVGARGELPPTVEDVAAVGGRRRAAGAYGDATQVSGSAPHTSSWRRRSLNASSQGARRRRRRPSRPRGTSCRRPSPRSGSRAGRPRSRRSRPAGAGGRRRCSFKRLPVSSGERPSSSAASELSAKMDSCLLDPHPDVVRHCAPDDRRSRVTASRSAGREVLLDGSNPPDCGRPTGTSHSVERVTSLEHVDARRDDPSTRSSHSLVRLLGGRSDELGDRVDDERTAQPPALAADRRRQRRQPGVDLITHVEEAVRARAGWVTRWL